MMIVLDFFFFFFFLILLLTSHSRPGLQERVGVGFTPPLLHFVVSSRCRAITISSFSITTGYQS